MTETKSNRPKDNALYQQRLKAWKPILTFKDAAIFFFVTGIIVLIIGIVIFISDQNVQEYVIPYTDCQDLIQNITCSSVTYLPNTTCTCLISVKITQDIKGPVYFYYGMNNFYQNHRQLMKSYDMDQLMGNAITGNSCAPLVKDNNNNYYAPCGAMANVIFNDTFILFSNTLNSSVEWSSVSIALGSDKNRYGTPSTWTNTVKPVNWQKNVTDFYTNPYKGAEELMVWMRPAPLPKFRKLHRIITDSNGLRAGNYNLTITYNYAVKSFDGEKFFIITNLSWIGGKNAALGILYLITGCIEIVIGIVVLVLFFKYPVKPDRQNSFIMSTNL